MSHVGDVCPDCQRPKAHGAGDCCKGFCSKWYAIRDTECSDECEAIARSLRPSGELHAVFAPSGLSRIVACPGHRNLYAKAEAQGLLLDESETPQAMEGTAAHWVAAERLQGILHQAGELAPNGVAIDDDMIDGAEVWVDALRPYRGDGELIETRVDMPSIHADCWGTPDYQRVADGLIFVPDYKYGHRYVDVFENWQLIAYALGACPSILPSMRVLLMVVQPRSYHRDGPVRTWELSYEKLRAYGQMLHLACLASEDPDAECIVTPSCYKCPTRHVCEAAQRAELSAFELAGSTEPLNMPPAAKALRLRQIRRALDHLKQMDDGLAEDITSVIRAGGSVPGWTMQSSAGREVWIESKKAEVPFLGQMFGVDVTKPGLIAPNQARKMGVPVEGFSERRPGEVKLVEANFARVFNHEAT